MTVKTGRLSTRGDCDRRFDGIRKKRTKAVSKAVQAVVGALGAAEVRGWPGERLVAEKLYGHDFGPGGLKTGALKL